MNIVVTTPEQNLFDKTLKYINNQIAALNAKPNATSEVDIAERRVYMKIRDIMEGFKNGK